MGPTQSSKRIRSWVRVGERVAGTDHGAILTRTEPAEIKAIIVAASILIYAQIPLARRLRDCLGDGCRSHGREIGGEQSGWETTRIRSPNLRHCANRGGGISSRRVQSEELGCQGVWES